MKTKNTGSISSCLIVKNEVKNLPLLIDDLRRFSDEIIMVDTGSTDGTLEWLKENQDNVLKLYEFEWINDFSAARNFSYSKATMDWVFWCDADDRISEDLINELNELKTKFDSEEFKEFNTYAMLYQYTEYFVQYRNRLMKRSNNPIWESIVHEAVSCENMNIHILPNNCVVLHQGEGKNSYRNIQMFEKNINNGHKLTNREIFCYAHELVAYDYKEDIEKRKEKVKLAQELVSDVLMDDASWEVHVWEAMVDIMAEKWLSSNSQANIGIGIIDRLEKTKRLRADVYYLRAVLYDIIKDKDNCIKNCYNAINTVMTGFEAYNERVLLSKIYPAMTIYNNAEDEFTKERMADLLDIYRSKFLEVDEFLKSIEAQQVTVTPIDESEIDLSNCEIINLELS